MQYKKKLFQHKQLFTACLPFADSLMVANLDMCSSNYVAHARTHYLIHTSALIDYVLSLKMLLTPYILF